MSNVDRKTKLLQEVVALFNAVGVVPGRGRDGELMARIQMELADDPHTPPLMVQFNPNTRMQCPLCKAPDFNECGCPADEQMAAMM